jgi:Cyclopropane fatty acid synthase and related methyltransferases
LPDLLIRLGIRNLLSQRLATLPQSPRDVPGYVAALIDEMNSSPVALCTDEANEQHYELPPAYFEMVLGKHRKYSACFWPRSAVSLDEAEAAALKTTCDRAELQDGQQILELGCGWGSLTLWMAEHFPNASITAVSNSYPQRQWIEDQLRARGLGNVRVITADMNVFEPEAAGHYDRIVSLEMFEHMRNWQCLFARLAGWLAPGGKFFYACFLSSLRPLFFQRYDLCRSPGLDGPLFFLGRSDAQL